MLVTSIYWKKTFTEFFVELFRRIFHFRSISQMEADEVQLLVLIFISISASIIGTFLVLRKMTMLANSISHTILLGILFAHFVLNRFMFQNFELVVIVASLFTGILTTFLTQFLNKKLQEDASVALVFTTLFALGIFFLTLFFRSSYVGVEAVVGNIDSLIYKDIKPIVQVCIFNVLIILLLYKRFQIATFDPIFSKNVGISNNFLNYLLMIQTSATSVVAFRAVGVFLFLSFLVTPVLISRLFTNRMNILIILSVSISSLCSLISVALSRHFLSVYNISLSTSGIVVITMALFYLVAIIVTRLIFFHARPDCK